MVIHITLQVSRSRSLSTLLTLVFYKHLLFISGSSYTLLFNFPVICSWKPTTGRVLYRLPLTTHWRFGMWRTPRICVSWKVSQRRMCPPSIVPVPWKVSYYVRHKDSALLTRRHMYFRQIPSLCWKIADFRAFRPCGGHNKKLAKQVHVLWMALFSWIEQNWHICGVINSYYFPSFKTHTENYHFLGTGIRGSVPQRNHENWYPAKFKPSTVVHVPVPWKVS